MARFTSTFGKIRGKIGNLSFYVMDRIHYVKTKSGPSRNTVKNSPNFATTRCNNREFGGASTAAKNIRISLGHTVKTFQDHSMNGRLAGLYRNIVQHSPGVFGERDINVFDNASMLHNFQMQKRKPFNSCMRAQVSVTTNPNRDLTTLTMAKLSKQDLKTPKGATHFKLVAVATPTANYKWQPKLKLYKPIPEAITVQHCSTTTPWLSCATTHNNLEIQLQLPITQPLPPQMVNFIWLGIQFGQQVNTQILPLMENKAMACITNT